MRNLTLLLRYSREWTGVLLLLYYPTREDVIAPNLCFPTSLILTILVLRSHDNLYFPHFVRPSSDPRDISCSQISRRLLKRLLILTLSFTYMCWTWSGPKHIFRPYILAVLASTRHARLAAISSTRFQRWRFRHFVPFAATIPDFEVAQVTGIIKEKTLLVGIIRASPAAIHEAGATRPDSKRYSKRSSL